jgi:cytochrome c-L
MKKTRLSLLILSMMALVACGEKGSSDTAAVASADAGVCNLVSTIDGSPLAIKAVDTDTAEAKEFLATCKNPYNAIYAADPKKAKKEGRREFNYNNCMGCHGGKLEGVMAPSLSKGGGQGAFDTKWVYAKNATDKGMFETISGGTPGKSGGTMFKWHNQVEGHTGDGLTTDQILRAMGWIRVNYQGDGAKEWMN